MKIRLSFIFVLTFLALVILILFKGLFEEKIYVPERINDKIENISVKEFYSEDSVEIKNLFDNNKFILINIWASWCAPCRQEHEYLVKLSETNNLKLIGINYKDKKNNAQKFLDMLGNPYDLVLKDTDGTDSIFLGAYGVPETFIINNQLKVLKRYIGPINQENIIEIKNLLKL
tara:strand:- start:5 stop:526 length:522 start_codon:yes stop_codon:yes gene_type:complete